MNHQLKWRFTSGLVLASMIGQFAVALAAPQPGALDRSSVRSEIASQIDRRFEKETPGLHKSVADKLLDFGASGVKENLVEMLTDFKMGVVQGARTAYNGNGTVVVIGAKNGWRLFKEYGEAAGIHYLDSVKLLPQKAVKIGKRFGKAGQDAGRFAAENAKNTGRAWKQTGKTAVESYDEFKDGSNYINDLAKDWYKSSARQMADGVRDGASDARQWASNVANWTKTETADAFDDLTSGTVDNVKSTGRWTKRVAKYWSEETVDAASSVNDWSKAAWDFTYDSTSKTWSATKRAGNGVFDSTTDAARDAAGWMGDNITLPARQSKNAITKTSSWNWREGWTEGLKGGTEDAANAWNHDDKLMATLWAMTGVGKGIIHILLLEPTVIPVVAAYGAAGTATLATLGFPSVGAIYLGGTVATAATYAGGTLATGVVGAAGTLGTVVVGGAGIGRTVGTAAVGTVATTGTAIGGAALTVSAAGVNTVRTLGTPIVGAVGVAGSGLAGGAEMVGSVVYNSGKMVGITAAGALGYTALTGYELGKMTFSVVQSLGVTVFDNAVMTPVGVVTNLAQALGSGAWTLSEDPIKGTLNLIAAGGVAVGTLVTSTGAFTYNLVKGILFGLAHGISAVGHAGVWVIGVLAKGVEFVGAAFNIPAHRRWAKFRREEVEGALENIRSQDQFLAERFGKVILVRVHWWGSNTGRVRFFITKNPNTGERWYFKRVVDKRNCEVLYKVTNEDPLVRAFARNPWRGIYSSGYFIKGCELKSDQK